MFFHLPRILFSNFAISNFFIGKNVRVIDLLTDAAFHHLANHRQTFARLFRLPAKAVS